MAVEVKQLLVLSLSYQRAHSTGAGRITLGNSAVGVEGAVAADEVGSM